MNLHTPQQEGDRPLRTKNGNDLDSHDSANPTKTLVADLHHDTYSHRSLEVRQHSLRFHTNLGVEKSNTFMGAQENEPVVLSTERPLELKQSHYVMDLYGWDAAPYIVEKYKLAFFTIPKVGCTVFKKLFRRMEGYEDWNLVDDRMPHDPELNGLKRLSQFSSTRALEILTSPEWTRAVFVREPKDRVLSAFLDKVVNNAHFPKKCCPDRRGCVYSVGHSFESFVWALTQCRDDHWNPQTWRMEGRYWAYINFVGHLSNAEEDTRKLLQKIGAWEEYGKTGWGKSKNLPIFAANTSPHTTGAHSSVQKYYTAETERLVEKVYAEDIAFPLFNFSNPKIDLVDNATARCERSVKAIEQSHASSYPTKPRTIMPNTEGTPVGLSVAASDYIYRRGLIDGAPIVVEEYRLVVFTTPGIGSTTLKKLCRRMMGASNWNKHNKALPHDPTLNGLRYLWDMSEKRAATILASDEWTKAVFVRDPKERLLSAYLSKSPHHTAEHVRDVCCPKTRECASDKLSFDEFVEVTSQCLDPVWMAQAQRMEEKYWPFINFVGRLDVAEDDEGSIKALLTRVGGWEAFGASGWGPNGKMTVLHSNERVDPDMMSVFYTKDVDERVEALYAVDYSHPTLGLSS